MHPTREDQATAELGTTEITPGVARTLVVTIAATLLAVPLLQWGDQLYSFSTGQRDSPWPDAADILTAPGVALHGWSPSQGNLGHKTLGRRGPWGPNTASCISYLLAKTPLG